MRSIVFTVTNDISTDQRMMRICSSLSANGYDVKIIGRMLKNSLPLNDEVNYKQIRLKCLFTKGKIFYLEYNLKLFIYLLFTKFDIASAVDLDTILPVLLVAGMKNRKTAFDAHELFTEVPELKGHNAVKRIWELVGKMAVPRIHICYTVCDSLARILGSIYEKKFTTVRNLPVLTEIIDNEHDEFENPIILYQGSVNKGRGLEELIKAIKDTNFVLIIAGTGDISTQIKKKVADYQMENQVIFKGKLMPQELSKLTREAWLGYNLLDSSSLSYFYSLSNKFFDYIHAGIPVLTNDFPEYKIINQTFEVAVFSETDARVIREKIIYLFENKDFYEKLKNNCLKARQSLNWQQEEHKLMELYDAI